MVEASRNKPGHSPHGGPSSAQAMREMLFGDLPWDQWPAQGGGGEEAGEPWTWFKAAREAAGAGRREEAIGHLRAILIAAGLESRHYLQAWHFLRQLGFTPPAEQAAHVYGVILEVSFPGGGEDILTAFEDGSARYWNHAGSGIVWDIKDDPQISPVVRELLNRGTMLAAMIGIWQGPRPAPVKDGAARVNMLTSSGLRFGEAPMEDLLRDPHGGGMLNAGAHLIKLLIDRAAQQGKATGG